MIGLAILAAILAAGVILGLAMIGLAKVIAEMLK